MSKETFYITTPIYYPSDKLHVGNTYCTVAADVMARYKRMRGYDVMFLTGTDEHGLKIEERANAAEVTPKEYVDEIITGEGGILDLWKLMNISYDRFIRTTDDYHIRSVQKIFRALYDKGDIYKSVYKGEYCTPCESFWTQSQLVDGNCPDCGRGVQYAEEEAYFFRQSNYAGKIAINIYDYLEPQSRVNEMINNFLNPGLEDICVSRTSFKWGIPVDFDPGHIVYVWVDALSNYITALGFANNKYDEFDKYWPCDIHFVGKEIVRLHSILWPALLYAMDLPLPKKVFGHGWLTYEGQKMSKSLGNVIDPIALAETFGVDSLRYFLMREFSFGSDGNFSIDLLTARVNSDLANDFGNLVSRTVSMVEKYFGGTLPDERTGAPLDNELITMVENLPGKYEEHMEKYAFQSALIEIFNVSSRANKYIDETAPWQLYKYEETRPRLATVLYNLLETIRICAVLLRPFIPDSCNKVFEQINSIGRLIEYDSTNSFGALHANTSVNKGDIVFPRFDVTKDSIIFNL